MNIKTNKQHEKLYRYIVIKKQTRSKPEAKNNLLIKNYFKNVFD